MRYLAGSVFQCYSICWRGFSAWRDFFAYSPVFGMDIRYLFPSNPKNMYFYRELLWEQAFPIGQPITDRFVYFNFFLTGQPIKCTDLHLSESIPSMNQILFGHPIKPQYMGLVNKGS